MFIEDPFFGFGMWGYPKQDIPETLCRVVLGEPYFDREGYLLSHEGRFSQYDPRSVPFSHPKEWETMARWLYGQMGSFFTLLTIDSSRIYSVVRKPHPLLLHGEFFTHVQGEAVKEQSRYVWTPDQPRERMRHIPPEIRMFYVDKFKASESKVPVVDTDA